MRPVWISGYFDNPKDAAQEAQQGIDPRLAEALPIAALTLDQIETWLNSVPIRNAYQRHFKERLLAQVQAWK